MNTISNILYWISTGLLVPVIVLLIFFFCACSHSDRSLFRTIPEPEENCHEILRPHQEPDTRHVAGIHRISPRDTCIHHYGVCKKKS